MTQNPSSIEVSAEIRNKLQPAVTAIELLEMGRQIPKEFLDIALKQLEEAANILG